MHIKRLLTPLPKIDSNVVGDGFKRMPYCNVLKCKVFSAHLLPYAINTCVIQDKIIAEVNKEFTDKEGGKTFSQLYDEKLRELQNTISKKYGKGAKMWEKLFEDNM